MLKCSNLKAWWKALPLRKRQLWSLALLIACVGGILSFPFDRIDVTTTASMRSRVYWLSFDTGGIKRGDTVVFQDSNIATKYKAKRLTKILACDAGDTLTVQGFKEYYCNGQYLGRAKDKFLNGQTAVNFDFNGVIPAGKMFFIGQHIDSYDSRYRGLVDKSTIIAKAIPLF